MKEQFIPYELALELKELGFDEPCFGYRDGGGHLMIKSIPHCVISAPTFSQAFRWFRKKYNLEGFITPLFKNKLNISFDKRKYDANICNGTKRFHKKGFDTYEEAELECLKKLIEICQRK